MGIGDADTGAFSAVVAFDAEAGEHKEAQQGVAITLAYLCYGGTA